VAVTSTTALFSRPVASKARIELDNVENPMAKKKKKKISYGYPLIIHDVFSNACEKAGDQVY
jgi:hypothetical protein